LSAGLGIALNFTALDPIRALYWSAVVNGVLAAPVMVLLMLLVRSRTVMGDLVVRGWLYRLGWASTVVMSLCSVAMVVNLAIWLHRYRRPRQERYRSGSIVGTRISK
jgi:Mn2+/Fe2+ NRAMP family transporter